MSTSLTANQRKRLILIAGMHRSGTSMLARLLNLHGAYLPLELHYADDFNERGYWESFEVQRLNGELLTLGDSAWHDTRAFSISRQSDEVVAESVGAIENFTVTLLGQDASVYVIKDPRICRLLPYWQRALSGTGAEISVLIPYRNPLEVANSIGNRDGFRLGHCVELWLRNVLDAERDSRGLSRSIFSYDEMLGNWPAVYSKICSDLSLDNLQPVEAIQDQLAAYMSDSLRHWKADDSQIEARLGRESLVTRTYRLLKRKGALDDQAFRAELETIRAEYEGSPDPRLLTQRREMLTELGRLLDAEESKRHEAEERLVSLVRTEDILRDQNATLNRERAELQETVNSLLGSLTWRLTAPGRWAVDWLLLRPAGLIAGIAGGGIEAVWQLLPVNEETKRAAKRWIFTTFRFPLRYTRFYREWVEFEEQLERQSPGPCSTPADSLIASEVSGRSFVARQSFTGPPPQPAKLIAFYLPQFHPIPENDRWWGDGFTEWANVNAAKPLFENHYQPRVPGDLSYYDLRDVEVQRQQVALAKDYGLGGFCFYFYWFHGQRLLEAPLLQYLDHPELDLPFCLCWANENWTRTWDGLDNEILIGQEHSKHDDLVFIQYVSRYLSDPRYIRVGGKPLLVVYRPSLLPNMAATAKRWRKWCRENGIGEIYLAYPQSFERVDPRIYGFDAAIEFPPNNTGPDIVTDQVTTLTENFSGFIYDWTSIESRSRDYDLPDYTLFRGVNPGWDNTARRGSTGAVFVGSTPNAYQEWLQNAITDTVERFSDHSERLVFINAWNEWAEGAYLEPDSKYGYAYLEATRAALEETEPRRESAEAHRSQYAEKIGLVIHDALPHGSQYLTLNLARTISREFGICVELVVLLDGGDLLAEYQQWANVHLLKEADPLGAEAKVLARNLAKSGVKAAIANTTVSGLFAQTLSEEGIRCLSLVHELPNIIRQYKLQPHASAIARHAHSVLFAAPQVAQAFSKFAKVPKDRVIIRPQGLYKQNRFRSDIDSARNALRHDLGLPRESLIVLGVGFLDHRKGVDLFVKSAFRVLGALENVYFVWVGHWNADMQSRVRKLLANSPHRDRFIFTGHRKDTDLFYAGADVFALTSREDPFPTTVMEALEVGVPVVAFADAGGAEELLRRDCGLLVPFEDVEAYARSLTSLLTDSNMSKKLGAAGAEIVAREFSFRHYVFDLLDLLGYQKPRVTAFVPSYNYARYLESRIASICSQRYPVFELIVIDDASSDGSVDLARKALANCPIDSTLIVNEQNSGSVFRQWKRGVAEARGDLIWICEADDLADPDFLERLVPTFEDEEVSLAYAQSRQIDEQGSILVDNYLDYTQDVDPEHWSGDFIVSGAEEIRSAMAVKNCIPNVSAVLFRKDRLQQTLDKRWKDIEELKIAGDWLIYVDVMSSGKVAFCADTLSSHRRHDSSVTISKENNETHIAEIGYLQDYVANRYELTESTIAKAASFVTHARFHLGLDLRVEPPAEPSEDNRMAGKPGRPETTAARAIAFYLPQYHPIPENDRWWGKGFTEWTNVAASRPLFEGHHQPRLPADLGFYDLRLEETRMAQAELAREYGIEGFCYWHYWFNGKRLLERPFQEVLQSGKPDFPFCLSWANETWSRRWLGEEQDVLMKQVYSSEDDRTHIRWLIHAFSDKRYIRVHDRPLFLVYRPNDLPQPQRTTDLFRQECLSAGLTEPYLVGINGHDVRQDARALGFDATLHFMPQLGILPNAFEDGPSIEREQANMNLGIDNDVTKIYDQAVSQQQMLSIREGLGHETIPCLFVGWDNTPRRGESAIVLTGNSAELFSRTMDTLVAELQSKPFEDRLLFINAWNEWAEGNYLEPDKRHGRAFLEAVSAGLKRRSGAKRHEEG